MKHGTLFTMKSNIVFVLLLISSSTFSQTKTELYVKLAVPSAITYCGYQPTIIEFTKKKLFFSCPEIEVDLKITKRRRSEWTAVDKNKNVYKVCSGYVGNQFTVLLLPRTDSGLKAIQFSKANLCNDESEN